MADYSTALVDFGGAVSSLFGMRGAQESASSYDEARRFAEQNALVAKRSTELKRQQLERQQYLTIGTQKAQVAGAGFASSGSALDLLRSSASQGALAKGVLEEQGLIQENAYTQQAQMFAGMSDAARSSATGQGIAGLIGIAGSVAALI